MYVALVKHSKKHPIGLLIRMVTGSFYTHAMIITDNGLVYDASESEGDVGLRGTVRDNKYRDRDTLLFHINVHTDQVLSVVNQYVDNRYDWVGVLGWFFKANDKKAFYCFEFVYHVLRDLGITEGKEVQIDANDLLKALAKADHVGKLKDFDNEKWL